MMLPGWFKRIRIGKYVTDRWYRYRFFIQVHRLPGAPLPSLGDIKRHLPGVSLDQDYGVVSMPKDGLHCAVGYANAITLRKLKPVPNIDVILDEALAKGGSA